MDHSQSAKENAFDVVLIDTAGRMQDNEPLMRALAKVCQLMFCSTFSIAKCVLVPSSYPSIIPIRSCLSVKLSWVTKQ
jgi:flagellar biosynthesis GTPase FlhF